MTLRELIGAVRRAFCRHTWQLSRFQALIDDGCHDVVCTKCGKQHRAAILREMEAGRDA